MNNKLAQISLLINGVLVIAVGVLFWLHFSSPSLASASEEKKDTIVAKPELPEIRSVNGAIAYIDLEKVLKNYKYFNDRKAQMEADMKKDEQRIKKKKDEFDKLSEEYMTAAQSGYLTQQQMQEKEKTLMGMRENLEKEMMEYEKKGYDLEKTLQKDWLGKVDDYLKGLSKEKNYSYVVTYVKGDYSAIVFANDSLNITDNVLSGLNAEYAAKGKK